MLRKWAFLVELDSPPPETLWKLHGFLLKAVDAELGLADEVVVDGFAPALLRPCIYRDVHVGSSIQSPFLAGCSHLFGVHDPCGNQII